MNVLMNLDTCMLIRKSLAELCHSQGITDNLTFSMDSYQRLGGTRQRACLRLHDDVVKATTLQPQGSRRRCCQDDGAITPNPAASTTHVLCQGCFGLELPFLLMIAFTTI